VDAQMSRNAYLRTIPRTHWFLRQARYVRYMAREVSCVFIGAYAVVLIVGLARLSQGQLAYEAYLRALASPLSILFHVVALAFALYHTTSWFRLAPRAMPIQRGEAFVPDNWIVALHYGAWIAITLGVLIAAGAL
jgi:fumarate reductase subunit C